MKKNKAFAAGCFLLAAICYLIATYGAFYDGETDRGIINICLTLAMLGLSISNFKNKKND